MSCPEAVTTSTVQAPTGSGGNAVLREYVRYPSRRPPRIGARGTTLTTAPARRHPGAPAPPQRRRADPDRHRRAERPAPRRAPPPPDHRREGDGGDERAR